MLNLSALQSFSTEGTTLGVVGYPIKHSLSPIFQNAAIKKMAEEDSRFNEWQYLKIEAPVEQLPEIISICKKKKFRGLNFTIPHKVEVIPLLDEIDPLAEKMGAVNTIIFDQEKTIGHNTDGYGISTAIQKTLAISMHGKSVIMLGAGGASRAACVQSLEEGCSELWIGNRSKDRLEHLLIQLKTDYPNKTIHGFLFDEELPQFPPKSLIINATALGLKPNDAAPLNLNQLSNISYVYDMVYGQHQSKLLKWAWDKKIPASNGLEMLIYQGAKSLSLWTQKQVPVTVMHHAIEQFMKSNP